MSGFRWPLVGVLEEPLLAITEAEYLGELAVTAAHAPSSLAPFKYFGPREPFHDFGLTVCRAYKRSPHGRRGPRITVPFGKGEAGVALFAGERLVGSLADRHAYLEPEHRGRGLGAELTAQLHVTFPQILRDRELYPTRSYTQAGRAMLHRSYRLLVDRGAIEEKVLTGT